MEVGKKSILNQFIGGNNSTQFVIPIYQRNYVWKQENISQLLSDIENMIPYIQDESKFHFFGTIVYIDTLHKGSFNEWTIIDGQQRLTTIFLILQALRQIYSEHDKVILKKYLLNDEDIINSKQEYDRYRLKPLVTDDNMYLKISNNNLDNLSNEELNSNIYRMFNYIKKILTSRKEKYDYETIVNALDKFRIVRIQLEKGENPQQVFESINSTGVNLTAADLIRNYILMNKDDATQTYVYENYWSKIEFGHVRTENLREFFRFYVSIKKKDTISEKDVYELFKREYEKFFDDTNEDLVLDDILSYAENYGYIKYDNSPIKGLIKSERIDNALVEFRNIKSNMPILFLMETIKLFRENKITEYDTECSIRLISNYMIRRNLCGEDTRYISSSFGNLLGRCLRYFKQTGKFYESVVRTLVSDNIGIGLYMPNDISIREHFEKDNLYNRDVTGFILKRIENNFNRIPYEQLNIEHVMPQTKSKDREDKIGENSTYEDVVNRIGNLTLVDFKDNSAMSNKNFEKKKSVLNESKHIKMNEYILSKEAWNEEEIRVRSNLLAEEFIKIFPYPELPKELPIIINLNEDNDETLKNIGNYTPSSVLIGNDFSQNVSTREDTFICILKYLNKQNNELLKSVYKPLKGDTTGCDVSDNLIIEVNKDELLLIKSLQTTVKKMNIDVPIRITCQKDQTLDNKNSLFD